MVNAPVVSLNALSLYGPSTVCHSGFVGLVKSSVGPLAESFDHSADGMIGTAPRMSSSIQVGLTGLDMLTTIVLAFGVVMLVIVLGKNVGTYGAQFAGDALTPAEITSKVNSRSLEVSVWPLLHFHGLTV